MNTVYLDTETTGLHPSAGDRIVEIGIVDDRGRCVLDTLVDPGCRIPRDAIAIHGIDDRMVAGAPTLDDLSAQIDAAVRGRHVVIYNAEFDTGFFADGLAQASHVSCAMKRFAAVYGQWNRYHGDYRWQKLGTAIDYIGYQFEGASHRALADAKACRAVWQWLEANDTAHAS